MGRKLKLNWALLTFVPLVGIIKGEVLVIDIPTSPFLVAIWL